VCGEKTLLEIWLQAIVMLIIVESMREPVSLCQLLLPKDKKKLKILLQTNMMDSILYDCKNQSSFFQLLIVSQTNQAQP